jgi:hypothetical protein
MLGGSIHRGEEYRDGRNCPAYSPFSFGFSELCTLTSRVLIPDLDLCKGWQRNLCRRFQVHQRC